MIQRTSLLFFIIFSTVFFTRLERLYQHDWLQGEGPIQLHSVTRLDELAEQLAGQGRIQDKSEFIWISRTHGWNRFQRGSYQLAPEESIDRFLRRMGLGEQDPIQVTILPGLEKSALALSLSLQLDVDSSLVISYFTKPTPLSQKLGLTPSQLFGRVTPETYLTYWTTDLESFLERVNRETVTWMESTFADELASSRFTPNDVFTLASIVEWEARHDHEREIISGLYQNRLRRRMRLQADPTVIYAIGEKRRLLYRDYQIDHPYNTYLISGLPPGPITNPSKRSIEAVLRPAKHDYLFMVATPDGTHEFNREYSTHLEAAKKWQDWIREQYRIKAQSGS